MKIQLIISRCVLSGLLLWPMAFADVVKIGIVAELSGADADVGKSHVDGAQLAIDEVNQQGGVLGHKLELVIEDNQGTNAGSQLAFNKLFSKHHLAALITPNRSTQVLSMMPLIQQQSIPAFIGGSDTQLTQLKNPWVFRMRPHDGYSAKAMVDYGVQTLKSQRWAIVYSADTFGINGKNQVMAELKKKHIDPVLIQSINLKSLDYGVVLHQLKQMNADILATYLSGPSNSARFAIQFRAAGLTMPWIGSSSLGTPSAIKLSNNALVGAHVLSDFEPNLNQATITFSKQFEAKYHRVADYYSAWTYDTVKLFVHVANRTKSLEPNAIRRALFATNDFYGTKGLYRFDSFGDGLHFSSVFLIEPHRMKWLKTLQYD